jgi:Cu-Zn family superoxide dismutase
MPIKTFFQPIFFLLLSLMLIGCNQKKEEVKNVATDVNKAICMLYPTEGSETSGTVTFTQKSDGILVTADVQGLSPGKLGFHIHEFGDCSRLDGKSAGGHFNPTSKNHGGPESEERHVGDLGNLVAGNDGTAHYEWTDTLISFSGQNSILGRAIIVHAGEDDLVSQPTGNAGARLACGVIGLAK